MRFGTVFANPVTYAVVFIYYYGLIKEKGGCYDAHACEWHVEPCYVQLWEINNGMIRGVYG